MLRGESESMRDIHHAHPLGGVGLERRDAIAHAFDEDFAAAARQRAKPCRHEIFQHLFHRLVEKF